MNMETFEQNLAKLSSWFRKQISPDYSILLYERISHIPDEPFGDIMRDIMDSERYWPTPRRFLEGWNDWQDRNRSRMIQEFQPTDCPACGGYGILSVWRYGKDTGTWYCYGMRCGECEAGVKALPREIPSLTRTQAVSKGWRLTDRPRSGELGA